MLVVHSKGMLMLGRKGLGRDREAQPVRVAISSTQTQARPNMKRVSSCGRACCGDTRRPRCPQLLIASVDSSKRQVNGLRVPICNSTFRLFEFRVILVEA